MKGYKILSEWDTLQQALKGVSIYRYGDGELGIMSGRAAKSQEHDKRLAAIMKRGLLEPGIALPCIPTFDRNGAKWHSFWHKYEARFRPFLNPAVQYGSAFVSRPDSATHIDYPAYWNAVRQLWQGKHVVLVRGSGKSLTAERLEGAKGVLEILCPVRHAFTDYDKLCALIRTQHDGRTVLLACGATATAMAYELGNEGIHCVDGGHIGMFCGRREGQFNPEGNNGKA